MIEDIISHSTIYVDCVPPGEHSRHRRQQKLLLMKLFDCKEGSILPERAHILFRLLPGDWGENQVVIYISSEDIANGDVAKAVRKLATDAARAIYPRDTGVINRSRWMLSFAPLTEQTLLFQVHGIGQRSVRQWLAAKLKEDSSCRVVGGWALPPPPQVQREATREPARQLNPPSDSREEEFDWAAFNKTQKLNTQTFLDLEPGDPLLILVSCVASLRSLFALVVKMSGLNWDTEQEASMANSGTRTYRLAEALSGRWV
jgi:hypothetical protein